jgi:hypothetical protein
MNINQLRRECEAIAKMLTPIDTGNLRYNSIQSYMLPGMNGFRVYSSFPVAPYGVILDVYGAGKKKTHKNWWSKNVYLTMSSFLDHAINVKQSNFGFASHKMAKFSLDDPERRERFYNSQVADEGRDKFLGGF